MTKRIASRESLSGESREISAFESFGRRTGGQGSHEELGGAAKVKRAGRLDFLQAESGTPSFFCAHFPFTAKMALGLSG